MFRWINLCLDGTNLPSCPCVEFDSRIDGTRDGRVFVIACRPKKKNYALSKKREMDLPTCR